MASPTTTVVVYPDSDGEPMSDTTLQYHYIVMIRDGLEALFADRSDVFVAANLLWYAVEGDATVRAGPDVMVAFGRLKGHRGSYRQWEEGGHPPDVVFEILSPGNRAGELKQKFEFYQAHGVEEYYIYDPDRGRLTGYRREGGELHEVPRMQGYISPLMGVQFELAQGELRLYGPNGRRFLTPLEQDQRANRAERRAQQEQLRAEQERLRAEQERFQREDAERQRDQERSEREAAERRAEAVTAAAEQDRQRAERLAARLRELGIDPDA
jgi:Uma2 family endonuclease